MRIRLNIHSILTLLSFNLLLFQYTNATNPNNKESFMKYAKNNNRLFKCIADNDSSYTAKLAREVFALCPPLTPNRFDQRILRLWGIKLSDYSPDSLIIIGGDKETGLLVLSPKHRLIWMKTFQTSPVYGDEIPGSFPAEKYALFYCFLMMDDRERLNIYFEKYKDTFYLDCGQTFDFIIAGYLGAIFDVRKTLLEYIDKKTFNTMMLNSSTFYSPIVSNLRFDAVSMYIMEELKKGRDLYFSKYGEIKPDENYIITDYDIVRKGYTPSIYFSFTSYISLEDIETYPAPSEESMATGWFSTCLKYGREDVNNALICDLFNDNKGDFEKRKTERFKKQLEKNDYYGYTLVREFLTNPMREMPTLEKIGTNFVAISSQSDIPLQIEPFSNSYAIDTIHVGETCQVYETGHDNYYFTKINRPVESSIAGPNGYAMILDRMETIYGYIPKLKVRQYTDNDLLNEKRYQDRTKSKNGVINNTDGYVNIHKEQNASSTIIGKLTGQWFYYWELPENWYIVVAENGLRGFVHKDCIREKTTNRWILEE